MTKRSVRVLSVFLVFTLAASASFAYVLLTPTRRWFSTPRTVNIDVLGMASVTTAAHGPAAAQGAVNAWNSGGVDVVSAAVGQVAYALGDGNSDVIFSDPLHLCTGTCLAATTTGYYDTRSTGTCGGLTDVEITDADVAFN